MSHTLQRRIAAGLLKCGESRVWISPEAPEKIKQAITRNDVRGLIKDSLIKKMPAKKSRGAGAKIRLAQEAKGRRSGPGKRKGAAGARENKKGSWLRTVRPQRELLKSLKTEGKLKVSPGTAGSGYGKLYSQIKGGAFRSKRHLISHLEERKLADVSVAEYDAAEKARKAALKRYVIRLPEKSKKPEGEKAAEKKSETKDKGQTKK